MFGLLFKGRGSERNVPILLLLQAMQLVYLLRWELALVFSKVDQRAPGF